MEQLIPFILLVMFVFAILLLVIGLYKGIAYILKTRHQENAEIEIVKFAAFSKIIESSSVIKLLVAAFVISGVMTTLIALTSRA